MAEVDMSLAYTGPPRRIVIPPFRKISGFQQEEVHAYIRPWSDSDTNELFSAGGGLHLRNIRPVMVVGHYDADIHMYRTYVRTDHHKLSYRARPGANGGSAYCIWIASCAWLVSRFPYMADHPDVSAIMSWFRDRGYTADMFASIFDATSTADWWKYQTVRQLLIHQEKEIANAAR